jgi:hypothetical protein
MIWFLAQKPPRARGLTKQPERALPSGLATVLDVGDARENVGEPNLRIAGFRYRRGGLHERSAAFIFDQSAIVSKLYFLSASI